MSTPDTPTQQERRMVQRLQQAQSHSNWFFWLYLALIALAEYLTAAVSPQIGLTLHAMVLVTLITYGALYPHEDKRKLALGLTLAPLIRLLSLSLPLTILPQIGWYPLVAVPLLIATAMIIRELRLSAAVLGLRWGQLGLQLLVGGLGLGLGVVEYAILRPEPITTDLSIGSILLVGFLLLVFTGFTEEIIFRGVLQHLAHPLMQRKGLWYISALFAVLHIGYLSVFDVIFVFVVGLIFAYIVQWSGSLLGVTLAHGLTNITLFLIMPTFSQQFSNPVSLINILAMISTLAALIAIVVIKRKALPADSATADATHMLATK